MATDIIGAAVQGGTGIGEIVAGLLIQSETQEKIKEHRETRPIYEIPSSIQEQVDLLRQRAQTGLPGEDLIASQIQQGTAQGISASREAATSAADLLGATTQLYGSQTQALTDLQIQSARVRSQNELALAQGLGNKARFEEQAFIYNEALPFDIRMNELMGISQSAYDLTLGGINTLAASGANLSGSGATFDTQSSSLYGGNTTGTNQFDSSILNDQGNYNYDFTSSFG
jgi:hypothetical protein